MQTLNYDVIVAGGGTAGSAAAIAAARRGHRVLLIEEQNCLGGISSGGGVGEWFASLNGLGDIFDGVVEEINRFDMRYDPPRTFNHEYIKLVWQLLAEKAGVDVLFHASVIGVHRTGDALTAVDIASCSQLLHASARYFIDATGDGDLCALAGAEFMQGDPTHGRVLHMTLTGWMYDTGKVQPTYLPEGIDPIRSAEDLPGLGSGWRVEQNRLYMNATKILDHDPTDPFSLSEAERLARKQLIQVVHYVQTHGYPTFALASSGAKIGIREGRRIVGEYVMTQDEILNRDSSLIYEDGVAVGTCQIDFHSLTKQGDAGWRQRLEPYHIPLRSLIAKGFDNLMMAGRLLSADQVVQSSARMTPTCCMMGQAAGTASALAVELEYSDIHDMPVKQLQDILIANGMELDPGKHTAFAPQDTRLDDNEPT